MFTKKMALFSTVEYVGNIRNICLDNVSIDDEVVSVHLNFLFATIVLIKQMLDIRRQRLQRIDIL